MLVQNVCTGSYTLLSASRLERFFFDFFLSSFSKKTNPGNGFGRKRKRKNITAISSTTQIYLLAIALTTRVVGLRKKTYLVFFLFSLSYSFVSFFFTNGVNYLLRLFPRNCTYAEAENAYIAYSRQLVIDRVFASHLPSTHLF